MAPTFVLVHSPLLGPATWSWVAGHLRERGYSVRLPSVVDGALSGDWTRCVEAVVQTAPAANAVVVGHGGAGPLLPAIASRMESWPARLIFVDSPVPPLSGDAPLVPEAFLPSLHGLARGGVLPKWSEWFGPEAIKTLVPDPDRRAAVLSELVELPVSFFEGRVPMPARWRSEKGMFVLLSDSYRQDAAEAERRGWTVREVPRGHLAIVSQPEEVADAFVDLTIHPL